MKTYKTWEAIKMLAENKKLEFDWYNDFGGIGRLKRDNENVDTVNCYDENGDEMSIGLDEKWTLVPQPVSFMEAAKSRKKIRVEHFKINTEYCKLDNILTKLGRKLSRDIVDILINGKWYIEEDEE